MPLHRYLTPAYFGGLPVTHDLINVLSGGSGLGDGSAIVYPKKAGPHPNAGTYFVAFGEDGLSGNVNRGLKALAENTDFLDDVIHADQSLPVVSAAATPVADISSVVISGNIFVGAVGEVNDQRTRSGLVALLDGDGLPLTVFSGGVYLPVLVSKIHDGLGSSVLGSGYYASPTVDLDQVVPTGQTYRLAYYTRGNLKTQSTKTYTRLGQGERGIEDLWALAKTTLSGFATFAGGKIFLGNVFFGPAAAVEFQEDVTIASTADLFVAGDSTFYGSVDLPTGGSFTIGKPVFFDMPFTSAISDYEVPLLTTDVVGSDDSSEYKLLFKFKNNSTTDIYTRVYTKVTGSGYVVTINAVWDDATTLWFGDDTTAAAARVIFSPATVIQWESRNAALPGGGWADNAWTGTLGAGADLSAIRFGASINNNVLVATTPLFTSSVLAVENPGEATNAWKLIFQFGTGSSLGGAKVRLYTGNNALGGGVFAITVNAAWNGISGAGGRWTADSTSDSALKLATDNLNLGLLIKEVTTVAWTEAQWDTVGSSSMGTIAISGEYSYAGAKTRTKLIPLSVGDPGQDNTGLSDWRLISGPPTIWQAIHNNGKARFPILVPDGSTLTRVRMIVKPGDTAGVMTMDLVKIIGVDFVTPDNGTESTVETQVSDGNTTVQLLDTGVVSHVISNVDEEWFILLTGSDNGGGALEFIIAIELTYTDPGHRG